MDVERFDKLTRTFGSGRSRRHALATLGGLAALLVQRGRAAQLGPPPCGSAGDVCTMLAGCCSGLTCVTSAINTNYGVCVTGGSGGTIHSGTSLVSPYSSSAQASGTVDTPAATTTSTTGTTTTTDPKAERQAKLQARRSRRSTRRNKIQSRRTTKSTNRKSRREDAEEAAILAAGPELDFNIAFPVSDSEPDLGDPYEVLQIVNPTEFPVLVSKVEMLQDARTSTLLGKTIAARGTLSLVSSRPNNAIVSSGEYLWYPDSIPLNPVCPSTTAGMGWVIKAAFSGEVENRTYTIHCNGMIEGLTVDSDPVANNKRKKRKRKQKTARLKNRKLRNKNGR